MTTLPLVVDIQASEGFRRWTLIRRFSAAEAAILGFFVGLDLVHNGHISTTSRNMLLMIGFYAVLALSSSRTAQRIVPTLFIVASLMTSAIVMFDSLRGISSPLPAGFFAVIALAGLALPPRGTVFVGGLSIVAVIVLTVINSASPVPVIHDRLLNDAAIFVLLFGLATTLAFVNARSHEQALRQVAAHAAAVTDQNSQLQEQRARLEDQAIELAQHRERLEQEVADRTAELERTLADLRRSAVALRELQSPMLPVADGVLVVPVVGAFDQARAVQFVEDLLRGIERRQARMVLLDVTGMPAIDTLAAQTLLQAAQAARLLGSRITLVGVAPAIAQALVALGLDLSDIRVQHDLQTAVADVIMARSARAQGT